MTTQEIPAARAYPRSDQATPRPSRPERRGGRLYVLDGLRLIAAVGVMCFHYMGARNMVWHDPQRTFHGAQYLAGYGWMGVELFFTISGFVICMSAWDRPLSAFFKSRVIRLYPAYWFGVLASSAVLFLLPYADGRGKITLSQVFTNLTMLEDPLNVSEVDPSYWTLWLEMRFYLLFSVVVWMGLTYRRVLNFAWLWLLAAVITPSSGLPLMHVVADPHYAPLFIGGIALYVIRREGPRRAEPWALLGASWLIAQHELIRTVGAFQNGIPGRLSWTVAAGILTAVYLLMAAIAVGLLDWITWRGLTVAGAMSYPLYLMHQEIGLHLMRLWYGSLGPWPLVASVAAAMLALAWLVQRFVERPAAARMRAVLYRPQR